MQAIIRLGSMRRVYIIAIDAMKAYFTDRQFILFNKEGFSMNNRTCPLPDIRSARIDPTLPVDERVRLFVAALGDPHRFRVGDTEVEVLFDDGAPSLQACLTELCSRLQ